MNLSNLNINQAIRTRFAPTPSGLLHPGNGVNFIITYVIARACQGRIMLRIDDLDKARCRKSYVEDIFRTLEWLELDYDEGPVGVDDFFKNWSQHTRLETYNEALKELRASGQLFACTCSRKDIRAISPKGIYPNTCLERALDFEAPNTAWRVKTPSPKNQKVLLRDLKKGAQQVALDPLDAFIVKQKNNLPAYQLASLIDDTVYNINLIIRGADLWESTLSQMYLAQLLGKTSFLSTTFWHHPLLTDAAGGKLSKSKGAGSLKAWREAGRSPVALYRMAGRQLGIGEEVERLEDLIAYVQ